MLKSLFDCLCKIGTLFKFSAYRSHSPSSTAKASTKSGAAAATSGDNSPVYIGGSHTHHTDSDKNHAQSRDKADSELRFKNTLTSVAHELPQNFRDRGNTQKPFITRALEKLVYDEPMIHSDPKLLQKASECLHTAIKLSTSSSCFPKLIPADGQRLMKELAKYISDQYNIDVLSQI